MRYFQVPYKRGPNKHGVGKIPNCNKQGEERKEQKQVVIKHKNKIYTEACYFAMKVGVNSTYKEMKYDEFITSAIFFKISKRWDPTKVQGVGKIEKLRSGGDVS